MSYFKITFNEKVLFNDAAYDTANYSATPALTVDSISKIDDYNIRVNVSGFDYDQQYTISVQNLRNIYGTALFDIDPTVASPSIPFILLSASAVNSTTIRLTFGGSVANIPGNLSLSNFNLSGSYLPTITNATYIDAETLDLTVPNMNDGGSYSIIVSNVVSSKASSLDPTKTSSTFTGTGYLPRISSATAYATPANKVRVVFDRAMTAASVENLSNWSFPTQPGSAPITKVSATQVNSTTVDIVVSGEMKIGTNNYSVKATGVSDLYGNTVNASFNEITFNGVGIQPQVVSMTQVDLTHVDVVFDTAVEVTTAQTITNYAFSGADTPVATGAVRQGDTVTVRVEVPFAIAGNYTVTVSNVTDLVGNVVDPSHKTASVEISLQATIRNHATLSTGLTAYWTLDSNFNDATGGGKNGTLYNTPTFVAAKINNGVSLNGSTQYGVVPANAAFDVTSFSISFWFKTNSLAEDKTIFMRGDGTKSIGIWFHNNGLTFQMRDGIGVVGGNSRVLSTGTFYFAVCTFSSEPGGRIRGYINGGMDVDEDTEGRTLNLSGYNLNFGHWLLDYYYSGVSDEVGWWGRVLTDPEIVDLYAAGAGLPY